LAGIGERFGFGVNISETWQGCARLDRRATYATTMGGRACYTAYTTVVALRI